MDQCMCQGLLNILSVLLLSSSLIRSDDQGLISSSWNPFCLKYECCNSDWLKRDVDALQRNLSTDLYGQHLVEDAVIRSLRSHVPLGSDRPLVFSFHGSSGMGKSFVSKLIARSWYKKGMDSSYVHLRIATKDFPFRDRVREYKFQLEVLIKGNVLKCPFQLFIFDEVDLFPPGLLDALTPFLTTYEKVDGVDYRKCIFIFISNNGQKSVNQKTLDNFNKGLPRESLKHKDMEDAMRDELYHSENTGLTRSKLIAKHFISFFLPFMPLERKHVRMCVERTLRQRLDQLNNAGLMDTTEPSDESSLVDDVMAELSFYDPEDNFATKGCKNVDEKVNYILGGQKFQTPFPREEL